MYVILGATGNIGSEIVHRLLAKDEKVQAVGRNPEKLRALAYKGAETVSADLHDANALTNALTGARAAFLMMPPNLASPDYWEEQERFGEAITTAAEKSKLQYAVVLSSIAGQVPSGTGPIAGLHRFEQKLNRVGALNALHLRPAFFMENNLMAVDMIPKMGVFASALLPDHMIPMIATRDIGAYAADRLLQLNFAGKQAQDLLGERDLSMNGVTAIIGRAIGQPDLRYVRVSYDQAHQALMGMGVPTKTADQFIEMYRGLDENVVVSEQPRSSTSTTPTSFETFVQEVFLPAFRGKAASA
jgi:uncharacterized protein YbjT (DUF2867 family)